MIQYEYAKDTNGNIVGIDIINKNNKVEYFCIGCGKELIPKTGDIRQHHFAHKSITIDCNKETYLHKLSKETLYNHLRYCKEMKIPFSIKYNRDNCLFIENVICNSCKSIENYNLLDYYENVFLEKPSENFIPDILLETNNKKNQLFIEIAVSHKSTELKKEKNKIIEIYIENENDVFDIIKKGINENSDRYEFINFNRNIIHPKYCNENDCKNEFIYFEINKRTIIKKGNIFILKELIKANNIHKQEITEEDYNKTNIVKYLGKYSKVKNKIKNIYICKYPTRHDRLNYLLLIEL